MHTASQECDGDNSNIDQSILHIISSLGFEGEWIDNLDFTHAGSERRSTKVTPFRTGLRRCRPIRKIATSERMAATANQGDIMAFGYGRG